MAIKNRQKIGTKTINYAGKLAYDCLKIANVALLTAFVGLSPSMTKKHNSNQLRLENKLASEKIKSRINELDCKKCLPIRYGDYIQNQELKLNTTSEVMDRNFLEKIITVESRWNPKAKSKSNARGLMQIKKIAWKQVEKDLDYKEHVYNPEINLEVGVNYLLWLEDVLGRKHPKWNKLSSKSKRELISASYNGGPTELKRKKFQIRKMPYETRNYVKKLDKLDF